jgi:endonuclease-3
MTETPDAKKKRAVKIVEILHNEYPDARCHLDFKNPFQLLISTILAAQCTDVLVNKVMGELYKKYKSPSDLAAAKPPVFEKEISAITFFRNKAKNVINCCKILVDKHEGKVPRTMDELTALPGVGRKTANVVLGNCFDQPAIIMDTHVIRLSQRLGLTENQNPDKIEADLMKIVPEVKRTIYSLVVGEHGRQVCHARNPKCPDCVINHLCPSKKLFYP